MFHLPYLVLAQGPRHRRRHVHCTLFHALDKVSRPLDRQDTKQHKEVLSLKKIEAGDYSWFTCQTMLGWIFKSVNMTITLRPHRVARFKEIVASILHTQHRVGVDKWHRVLGELRSMEIALPGARVLFSQMQEALCPFKGKRVTLSTGVHNALADFKWLSEDVANRPTKNCTSLSRSDQLWTATTMHPDTCAGAWCSQDQQPYLGNCHHSLALRSPPQTPTRHTPKCGVCLSLKT